jgi:hypothetical protein
MVSRRKKILNPLATRVVLAVSLIQFLLIERVVGILAII